jgi:hypothetical protein
LAASDEIMQKRIAYPEALMKSMAAVGVKGHRLA